MKQYIAAFQILFERFDRDLIFNRWLKQTYLSGQNIACSDESHATPMTAREWFDSRWTQFEAAVDDKAQFDDHFLVISRQLKVACAAEFTSLTKRGRLEEGYDGLGVFWSWDLNNAEAYWGGKGASVNLQARVALSEIDLESTLLLNLDYELGERETEIRLYEGSVVEIMMIENCTTGSKVPIRRVSFTS